MYKLINQVETALLQVLNLSFFPKNLTFGTQPKNMVLSLIITHLFELVSKASFRPSDEKYFSLIIFNTKFNFTSFSQAQKFSWIIF